MVKPDQPVVVWNLRASQAFKKLYNHIRDQSPANAEKVQKGITQIIDNLPNHPEKYPPDKYKRNNPGNYRAFEKYSYRVAYKHTGKGVRILRSRHVKQEPKPY